MSSGEDARRIPIDDRAEDMIEYFESEGSVLFGDFSDDFDEYVAYLAVERGPTSSVNVDDGEVSLTEADLAIASFMGEKRSEAEDIDWKTVLEGAGSGVLTVFSGGQALRTGDAGWYVGGLLTGYYSKLKFEDVYEDFTERREFREERRSSIEGLNDDYPGIDDYEMSIGDADDSDVPVSVVRPGDEDSGEEARVGFQ